MARQRPLGTFDRAQALTASHAPYNLVTVVRLDTVPEELALQRAIETLWREHAILRSRIVDGDPQTLAIADDGIPSLEIVDRIDDEGWISQTERELAHHFDLSRAPLARVVLLRHRNATSSDLMLNFPHALVDGIAVTRLVEQLLCRLAADRSPAPIETGSGDLPPSCDELFPSAWQRPRRIWPSLRFLGRQMADEVSYRLRTRGGQARPPVGEFSCRILPIALTRNETIELERASRRRKVSLVAILEAAMLIAVARRRYPGKSMPHRYCAFPLLRPYLEPPVPDDVIACYITVLRLTTPVSGDDDVWRLATKIHRNLERSMRRGERFLASIWSLFSMRTILGQSSHRMATTAVSYTGATRLAVPDEAPGVREVHAFVSNFPVGPEYSAQARIFAGRLWLDILYLSSDMSDRQARQIANEIRSLLTQTQGSQA